MMNNQTVNNYIKRHNDFLHNVIANTDIPAKKLKNAILYSVFPGGKRFRPVLVYLCGELLDTQIEVLDIISASIELMHSFSLVHDDLPAMDDDDYRRDKLSCHRAFDEATAILAGDAIQALAVDILITLLPKYLSNDKVLNITHELLLACGPSGMVSGQSLDMSELTKESIDEKTLLQIHSLKTGKLIAACIKMTLATTNSSLKVSETLNSFAEQLGILFQMQDDFLDKYGDNGKFRSSDKENNKLTFANIYNEQELLSLIQNKYNKIFNSLNIFADNSKNLNEILLNLRSKIISKVSYT